jgi:riboflavin kinase
MAVSQIDRIHLPDLSFCRLCEEFYGINRGVYNTIDFWFFEKGVKDIVKRREMVLDFLEDSNSDRSCVGKFRNFGPNGLSPRLDGYWLSQS